MKTLRVTFSDGSQYDIPAKVIIDNWSAYYEKHDPEYAKERIEDGFSNYDIEDWATNNMNWCDVAAHAVQVRPLNQRDMNELWANAKTQIIISQPNLN
jgi:hypothetical protein